VVGNRPQFIKSAPLSLAFRQAGIEDVVLHTGQHWDPELSEVFFRELELSEPAYRLDLRTSETGAMVAPVSAVVAKEQPDWVLVYGDTNTTHAGALAAETLPIAHVEAGLRSFDLSMPEERNRIAVDGRSTLLLCPDERSAAQLRSEAVSGRIAVVGDVMADAIRIFGPIARSRSNILDQLGLEAAGYLLATVHREANVTDETRLRRIAAGLRALDRPVVFPAHPRTRAALTRLGLDIPTIDPVGYLDMQALTGQAAVVLTDSGGLQKEAYWHRVPCVTLRPSTEWVDTVDAGANVLVDDDPDALARAVAGACFPADAPPLYGDGHASERIADALYASRP